MATTRFGIMTVAPRRCATNVIEKITVDTVISIHAPTRGATGDKGKLLMSVTAESGTSFYRFFRIFKNPFYVHFGCYLRNGMKSYRCFTVYFTVLFAESAEPECSD